jgi:hypothetical protein
MVVKDLRRTPKTLSGDDAAAMHGSATASYSISRNAALLLVTLHSFDTADLPQAQACQGTLSRTHRALAIPNLTITLRGKRI